MIAWDVSRAAAYGPLRLPSTPAQQAASLSKGSSVCHLVCTHCSCRFRPPVHFCGRQRAVVLALCTMHARHVVQAVAPLLHAEHDSPDARLQ